MSSRTRALADSADEVVAKPTHTVHRRNAVAQPQSRWLTWSTIASAIL